MTSKLLLVDVPPTMDQQGDDAVAVRARRSDVDALVSAMGLDASWLDCADLLANAPAARTAFADATAAIWLGRLTFFAEATQIVAALEAGFAAAGRPGARVVDTADAVEEAFACGRFYPLLEAAGVPQAPTARLPLDPSLDLTSAEVVEAALRPHLHLAEALLARGPVFFRTDYGTLKVTGGLHGAETAEELVEGAVALITQLAPHQPIGALCVREALDIATAVFRRGRVRLKREYRVYVVFGRPVMWLYDYSYGELRLAKVPRDQLVAFVRPSDEELDEIEAHSARAGAAFAARFLVLDFAVTRSGRVVCLETNPGHCAGLPHLAAYVGPYAALLATLAGAAAPTAGESRALADRLGFGLDLEGVLFGFFGAERPELPSGAESSAESGWRFA